MPDILEYFYVKIPFSTPALSALLDLACQISLSFKTACTEIGGGSGRRTDMTFLDFWSTSSALYAPGEGPKDAATVAASFKPSSGP